MDVDKEMSKLVYCIGCLSHCDPNALHNYKIQNESLKTIFQVNEISLCYICKHLAQRTEQFIQNVQSNQILLANVCNITDSVLQTARLQSQLITLKSTSLDLLELANDDVNIEESFSVVFHRSKSKDPRVKVEVKDEENTLLDHLEGEFVDDDNDFHDTAVKEEDDDFPLKDLLKEEFGVDRISIDLGRSKRSILEKRNGRRKKQLKSKTGIQEDYLKEDFPLSDILKDKLVAEELGLLNSSLKKKKFKKKSDLIVDAKDDSLRIQTIYITKEQCMEERVKMAQDKKYINSSLKCLYCIKGFHFKESYERHMESHSKAMGDYECDICKQRMSSNDKLLRHKKCHEVRYECPECGLTRINRLTIKDHYNACHLKLHSYSCPHCPKSFKRQVSLRKHVTYAHKNTTRVTCSYCQKTYANKEVLKSHLIVVHPNEVSTGEVLKRYICQECGMAFKAPSQLRNHSVKHSMARNYYCVECDKRFKSEAAFKQHVKIAAPHVNYGELPLPCTRCDKRFAIRRDLERHTNRVHLNIRPYQCDKCDRAYVNKYSLNEHMRFVHDGQKRPLKYPCSMCDKVFDRNQTLKAHIRTHTGERPYQCARCAAQFSQSSALGTHVRLVHLRLTRDGRPKPASAPPPPPAPPPAHH